MIPISSDARTALFSRSLSDRIEVIVTPSVGSPITFEDRDIVPASLTIGKMCTDQNKLGIGTSALNQLEIKLRYNFESVNYIGAQIETKYYLIFDDDEEMLAHHIFFIDSIEQTTPTIASVIAYCNLKKLSKPIGSNVFTGTPFEIFAQINYALGDTVINVPSDGTVPQRYQSLPNVNDRLQLSQEENGCETYRDVANALCQMLGVFIQTVPSHTYGELYMYHTTSDLTVTLGNRKEYTHNRYVTTFDSVRAKGNAGEFVSPVGTEVSNTTFDIGDSPCWDYGSETGLQLRTDNLRTWITQYSYTPSELTMWSEPTIECGDRITVSCVDGDYDMLVTEVQWVYKNNTVVKSAGEEKGGKTSASSGSSRSSFSESANKLVMHSVMNNDEISLEEGDLPLRLCRINFSTKGSTEVIWLGEALLQAIADAITVPVTINVVDAQGNPVTVLDSNGNPVVFGGNSEHKGSVKIRVTYKLDSANRDYYPKDEYLSGDHILSMFHTAVVEEQSTHAWEVWLEVLYGSVVIGEHNFRGTLMGQNLVAIEMWSGIITLVDQIANEIMVATQYPATDSMELITRETTTDMQTIVPNLHKVPVVADNIGHVPSAIGVQSATENVTIIFRYGDHILRCGLDNRCGGGRMFGA